MDESRNPDVSNQRPEAAEERRARLTMAGEKAGALAAAFLDQAAKPDAGNNDLYELANRFLALSAEEDVTAPITYEDALGLSLDELMNRAGLSIKQYNGLAIALQSSRVTVRDLLPFSYKEIGHWRFVGEDGASKLRKGLEALGVTLRDK